MDTQEIEIIIEANGRIRLQTKGFHGADCLDATKALESIPGVKLLSQEMTADFYTGDTRSKDGIRVEARH